MAVTISDKYAITLTRTIAASRERVWQAFTDPKQLVHWWGPNGFTNTLQKFDLRPGGKWRHIMHGPDGRDYPNNVTFDEITQPSRLVFTHLGDVELGLVAFQTVITLEDLGGQTKVTLQNRRAAQEEKDKAINIMGAVERGNQTLARLAKFVPNKVA